MAEEQGDVCEPRIAHWWVQHGSRTAKTVQLGRSTSAPAFVQTSHTKLSVSVCPRYVAFFNQSGVSRPTSKWSTCSPNKAQGAERE